MYLPIWVAAFKLAESSLINALFEQDSVGTKSKQGLGQKMWRGKTRGEGEIAQNIQLPQTEDVLPPDKRHLGP